MRGYGRLAVLGVMTLLSACQSGRSHVSPERSNRAMLEYYLPRTEVSLTLRSNSAQSTSPGFSVAMNVANRGDPRARLFFRHDFNAISSNAFVLTVDQNGLLHTASANSEGAIDQVLSALGQGTDATVELVEPTAASMPESIKEPTPPPHIDAFTMLSVTSNQSDLGLVRCEFEEILRENCELETEIVLALAEIDSEKPAQYSVCAPGRPNCLLDRPNTQRRAITVRIVPDETSDRLLEIRHLFNLSDRSNTNRSLADNFQNVDASRGPFDASSDCVRRIGVGPIGPDIGRSCEAFIFYRPHIPVRVRLEAEISSVSYTLGYGSILVASPNEALAIEHRSSPFGANALATQFQNGRLVAVGVDQPAFVGTALSAPFAAANAVFEIPENLFSFTATGDDEGED